MTIEELYGSYVNALVAAQMAFYSPPPPESLLRSTIPTLQQYRDQYKKYTADQLAKDYLAWVKSLTDARAGIHTVFGSKQLAIIEAEFSLALIDQEMRIRGTAPPIPIPPAPPPSGDTGSALSWLLPMGFVAGLIAIAMGKKGLK